MHHPARVRSKFRLGIRTPNPIVGSLEPMPGDDIPHRRGRGPPRKWCCSASGWSVWGSWSRGLYDGAEFRQALARAAYPYRHRRESPRSARSMFVAGIADFLSHSTARQAPKPPS